MICVPEVTPLITFLGSLTRTTSLPHVDLYVPNHEAVVLLLLGPWFLRVTGEFVVGKLI